MLIYPKTPSYTGEDGYLLPTVRHWLDVSGAVGDTQVIKLVSAPEESSFYQEDGKEIPLEAVDNYPSREGQRTITFTPDVSGKYILVIEDWDLYSDSEPLYQGSPDQEYERTLLSREEVTMYASAKMRIKIGPASDSVDLVFYVSDLVCHDTTREHYGSDIGNSPRFESWTSERARQAALGLTDYKLTSLVGLTNYELRGNPGAYCSNLADHLSGHFSDAVIHSHTDDTNLASVAKTKSYPSSTTGVAQNLTSLANIYSLHIKNDGYNVAGDVHTTSDYRNTLLINGASDAIGALNLYADLYRCVNAHFQQITSPSSHSDTDSLIPEPAMLFLIIAEYLEELARLDPLRTNNASPLAMNLIAAVGAEKEA